MGYAGRTPGDRPEQAPRLGSSYVLMTKGQICSTRRRLAGDRVTGDVK